MRDQNIVVLSCGHHTNKYEKVDARIRPGIHPFYKQEISKLLSDESGKTPYSILGSDTDPFIVCFTSKHLLGNISKYEGHHAVFHIDGTYKLIKNRFPVIVYGRSDMNGQLHLISVAICSDETAETYSHFYK